MHRIILLTLLSSCISVATAQRDTSAYSRFATAANRSNLYAGIRHSIGFLSTPLTDSTEEVWEDAFSSMELVYHTSPWEESRLRFAFDSLAYRSPRFQRAFIEVVFTCYPTQFNKEINSFLTRVSNEKVFAMCAEYLLRGNDDSLSRQNLFTVMQTKFHDFQHPILLSLAKKLTDPPLPIPDLSSFFDHTYLTGNVVLFSFQRKNRDYPGLVIVRDTKGDLIRNTDGSVFYVAQLARSLSNLPGYLTDGSTPQGIFRMKGFDVSRSSFIGPTTNIQLTMPGEATLQHLMKDSSITDSICTEAWYAKLLPQKLRPYFPIYGSYFAGMAGRTEIIAHGTTVDPDYYRSRKFFPYTPTEGCLCTKEIWNPGDGRRIESDQQKLVNAIKKAGGPDGYCIVLEINDDQRPVTLEDVLTLTSIK